jgi:hypothetical protein
MRITLLASLCLIAPAAAQSMFTAGPLTGNPAPQLDAYTPAAPGGSYLVTNYAYDDGSSEGSVGVNNITFGILWLQHFSAGCDTIDTIEVVWGSPAAAGAGPPDGTPAAVYVWDDPTNDGNPADAVLLTTVPTVVANNETDIFNSIAIPPTAVSGTFFIGAATDAALRPAPLDTGQASLGRGWITGSSGGFVGLDPVNLSNAVANNVGLVELDAIGIPGVWLIRAAGTGAPELTTLFSRGNGISTGMQMFDITVLNPNGVVINELDLNVDASGVPVNIDVYMCDTTYVGNEANQAAWRYMGCGTGNGAGLNLPTNIDIPDFGLPMGAYGIAVHYLDPAVGINYTNGNGANQQFFDANIQLDLGIAKTAFFGGSTFSPRVWNGTVRYCVGTGADPAPYCVSTVNSNGCSGGIVMSGTPSVSSGSFFVDAKNVMNKKPGLLFYGTAPSAAPFMGGTLCVATPLKRTKAQPTGGTPKPGNDCTGAMTFDFGAYIQGGGDPAIVAGSQVFAQYLHRDPGSAFGWGLTDGGQFTMHP